MTQQEAKAILTTYGAPVNIAQHIEAINTTIRALGGKATMAEIWAWANSPQNPPNNIESNNTRRFIFTNTQPA